jgi:cytochrome d ubiquinol oxidase subunit II
VLALVVAITLASFRIQPHLQESFAERPWVYVFPFLAVGGLTGVKVTNAPARVVEAVLCSCLLLVGLLASAAFGLYPYVLPSTTDPALGLTIDDASSGAYGQHVAWFWFMPGIVLAVGYCVHRYRSLARKVTGDEGC